MPTPSGVVFDLDGTLVDTEAVSDRVLTEVLADLGHDVSPDDLLQTRGRAWSWLEPWLESRFGVSGPEYRARSRPRWGEALDEGVITFDDTIALLSELVQEGLPVAVCTSSGRAHLDRVVASVPDLRDAFAVSVSATDVARHKPDPLPYRRAVSLLGTPPARTVAIEDSATGVASAVAAGLRVIGRHSGPPTDLSEAHLQVTVVSRADLDRVLV